MLKKTCAIFFLTWLAACSGKGAANNATPSWFIQPKQNNASALYGVGDGFSLEDATKSALADTAARLVVSISSESSLLREENQNSTNEEMRQQIKQNIEKIEFVNFKVSRSEKIQSQFFVEVEMPRDQFVSAQKDKLSLLDKQISNLNKNISSQNLIQKRAALVSMLDYLKQAEILARILQAAGENANLKQELDLIASTQDELNKLTDKVEFYFEIKSPAAISSVIRTALNKEKIKIAKSKSNSANQVEISIDSTSKTGSVYGSNITKLKIDFENKVAGKVIASNSIEVAGSSTIDEKESYAAAVEALKDKIAQDGILKILGILN